MRTIRDRDQTSEYTGIKLFIKGVRKEKNMGKKWFSVVIFLSYLSGVYGILYTITFIFSLSYNPATVWVLILIVCSLVWKRYVSGNKNVFPMKLLLLTTVAFVLFRRKAVLGQLQFFIISIQSRNLVFADFRMTEVTILFGAAYALSLFYIAFIERKGWIFYFITVPIVLFGPYIGKQPDLIQISLFICFHAGNCVWSNITESETHKAKQENLSGCQMKTAGSSIVLLTLTSAFFMIFSYGITVNHMDELFEIPIILQDQIRQATDSLFQRDNQDQEKGVISRGNNYPTGAKQLKITLTKKPEENLYLKNFTGGRYLGNQWGTANETSYYEMAEQQSQRDGYTFHRGFFESRQYELIRYIRGEEAASQQATVRHLSSVWEGYYIPYLSKYLRMVTQDYTFAIYNQKELLEVFNTADEEGLRWYRWMEEPYAEFVEENYLQVPRERIPKLAEFCAETPLYDISSISNFIVDTLHSKASYTLSPGITPLGKDIVDYFLFENGKGYCQHFASAAVLMYRLYGIPARYVTGYMAPISLFREQNDGNWEAELTDMQDHAWVEIYREGIGWVPVEVTPSRNWEGWLSQDNVDESTNIDSENQQDLTIPTASDDITVSDQPNEILPKENWFVCFLLKLATIILIMGILIFLLSARRKYLQKQYNFWSADQLFARLLEVLHFCGFVKEYTGMEADFRSVLVKALPQISEQEAKELMRVVNQEAFGRVSVSAQETESVLATYQKVCGIVYENLMFLQKLYFRYWKGY